MGRLKNSHRRAIEYISLHPELLKLEDVLASSVEMNLFNNRGTLVSQPDVVFYLPRKQVVIVEYKNSATKRARARAGNQLAEASRWFSRQGYYPVVMIVDGERYPELKDGKDIRNKFNQKTITRPLSR